jgi:DNA-binding response OmpR family regulator
VNARILIIEDNADLALGLSRSLEIEGYSVAVAADGYAGLGSVEAQPPDLIVLDLMLPRLDGFHVLRTLRATGHDMPVLILSARGEEVDKVQGFRLGADNYAVKPIGVLELLARVEAMLRRRAGTRERAAGAGEQWSFGNVRVDAATRSVLRADTPVELSPKEFDLLVHLLRRAGSVARRDELLRDVWGYKRPVPTRTVDAHMALLRSKLEPDPAQPRYLLTVRKAGYRLDPSGGTAAGPPPARPSS